MMNTSSSFNRGLAKTPLTPISHNTPEVISQNLKKKEDEAIQFHRRRQTATPGLVPLTLLVKNSIDRAHA